jgi:hypothetical protein
MQTSSGLGRFEDTAFSTRASNSSSDAQNAATLQDEADLHVEGRGEWRAALAAEAKFQLTEFTADFNPMDISNLLLGLADLSVPIDADLRTAIRKVRHEVSTKTIIYSQNFVIRALSIIAPTALLISLMLRDARMLWKRYHVCDVICNSL